MAAQFWAPKHALPQEGHSVPTVKFAWSGLQELTLLRKPREGPFYTKTFPECHWTPALRRLVNQSFDTFCSVQKRCSEMTDPVAKLHLIQKSSKMYRVYLHEQVQYLKTQENFSSEGRQHGLEHKMELFTSWELVWHLCEILYIERLPAGCLMQQLLMWVTWHSHHVDSLLAAVKGEWDVHPHYWDAVFGLVFQGRMKEACQLLENHSGRRDHGFSRMIALLQRCPVSKSLDGVTYQELVRAYSEWKLECKRRTGDFVHSSKLSDLCSILSGDESTFNKVVENCPHVFTHWYQILVAHLLFTDPLVEANDYLISHLAEVHSRGMHGGEVDKMILATIQGDIIELIKLSSASFGNWWFVSHLTDLLYHLGVLESSQIKHGAQQREFLLLEYASSLFNHSSLWQLGVEYFAYCPSQGRSVLGLLIDRVPLTSEKKAHKVLHLCQRFKLKEQAKCVCRVLAVRFIKAGRMGAALEWAVGAKDTRLICHIAERYMTDYQNAGRMRDLRVLRTLDQDMFLSTDLTFLGRYCEFVTLFEQERFTEAGSLLVELLSAEVVPKKFWLTLLTDALPLLDLTDMIALTKEQTEILSMYLEDLLRSCDKVISEDMMDQVGVISLALSHSVSNSFH